MAKIVLTCVHCEISVERYPSQVSNTTYCSRKCRSDYMRENNSITFNCVFCDTEKRIRNSSYNPKGNNFCTRACKDEWQKEGLKGESNPFFGEAHTDESKAKISEAKVGKLRGILAHNYNSHEVTCVQCGKKTLKIQYLINRSVNLFCTLTCHGEWKSEHLRGENSPTWNPNLTNEERIKGRNYPEYYTFLKDVLERDDYTCDICSKYGKWGKGLNVHHLNGYGWDIENRTNVGNGITLCKGCHVSFHKTYGYGKNTTDQYSEYRMSVIEHNQHANTVVTS